MAHIRYMHRSLCTQTSFERAAHLGKVVSMQHSFEDFSERQRRVELKSVGNFGAKTVLVEHANQFSLEELFRTH